MSSTAMIPCAACGGSTPQGKRFCIHCGSSVQAACPACGAGEPESLAAREEAAATFAELGAAPWLERARALATAVAA